jgi:hypothetical protein
VRAVGSAGIGTAKLTLSFDECEDVIIAPTVFWLPVVGANAAK